MPITSHYIPIRKYTQIHTYQIFKCSRLKSWHDRLNWQKNTSPFLTSSGSLLPCFKVSGYPASRAPIIDCSSWTSQAKWKLSWYSKIMSTSFFHLCWFFHSKKTQHVSPRANYHLLFHFFHLNANSVRQFLSQPTSMMPLGCWMSRKKINRWCLTGTGSFCEIVACPTGVTCDKNPHHPLSPRQISPENWKWHNPTLWPRDDLYQYYAYLVPYPRNRKSQMG